MRILIRLKKGFFYRLASTHYYDEAEILMVERDLKLLKQFPEASYHVLHLSSLNSLFLIQKAKKHGLNVTCEVTPHHLYFNDQDIDCNNSSFKMNPPLRSSCDQDSLQKGLADGTIDWVATDHAPHDESSKQIDFKSSSFGTLGLQTALPVLMDLYQKKVINSQRLVQVFSTLTARFLGISNQYGSIQIGKPLNAVEVSLEQKTNFKHFVSKSQNSVFKGSIFNSKILRHYNQRGIWSL